MRLYVFIAVLAAGCLAGQSAAAEESSSRQHDAHVHGIAQLNVAFDNSRLDVEFLSPAANIVGFEHEPSTAEQEKAVHDASETLQDANRVFALPAEAGCVLAEAEVETTMLKEEHEEHDEHDNHDEETHSEFHVTYAFDCTEPNELRFMDVLLFESFPGTEEIEAQIIGPRGQTAKELTASNARIEF